MGATLFSTLDLTSEYNQVPMAERDKTAFCTPFGLFECAIDFMRLISIACPVGFAMHLVHSSA